MVALRELSEVRDAIRAGGGWIFRSPKAKRPMPVASGLMFGALIRSALDPYVRAISAGPPEAGSVVGVQAFVAARFDGSTLICVYEQPDVRWRSALGRIAESAGLSLLPLNRSDLSVEPHASNCRKVWSCRGHSVEPDERSRIVSVLREEIGLPLAEICREVRSGADAVRVVSALACQDVLALDLASQPLGARTPVMLTPGGDA